MIKKTKQNLSVLVVDDDPSSQIVIKRLLTRRIGISNVTVATNGDEAIDICKKQTFDIIFMDIRMPGISGTETMNMIKEFEPNTKFIAYTAFSSYNNNYWVYGFDGAVVKPISMTSLNVAIESIFINSINST